MSTLIVGGGLAAQRCAETLRREGYDAPITMLSDEPVRPYDRPPLSKEVLASADEIDTSFRAIEWYEEQGIDLVLGDPATDLETGSRTVWTGSGAQFSADRILLATGAGARTISAFDGWTNSSVLRSRADAELLRESIRPGIKLAIVGGGFIGLEVAATARAAGADVIVAEAEPIPLRGLLGPELGSWLAEWHCSEGIDIRCSCTVQSVEGDRQADSLVFADGNAAELDHLLVAVGSKPNTEWLRASGLDIEDGVRCDSSGRSDADGIWAAGDMARPWNERLGRHHRAEHWEAAAGQGRAAARDMLGLEPIAEPMPSFWSDMHGVRIQHLGYAPGDAELEIDGRPAELDFEAVWRREGRPVAALAVGRPRSVPALRKMFDEPARAPKGK